MGQPPSKPTKAKVDLGFSWLLAPPPWLSLAFRAPQKPTKAKESQEMPSVAQIRDANAPFRAERMARAADVDQC